MAPSDTVHIFGVRDPDPSGRPQMPDDAKDQVQISVRMPADLVSALESRAQAEDRTLSAELRRIARRALTEEREAA